MNDFDLAINEHIRLVDELKKQKEVILKIARALKKAIKNENKIMLCGNGGSAADAQHMAGELVGRFEKDRKGIYAIALTTDTSVLTSISNDYSYETVFERQIDAIGKKGDVLIGFSTSGRSKNIVMAFKKAKEKGIKTVGILGNPGELKSLSDLFVSFNAITARVQEIHSIIIHIICKEIEKEL